MIMLNLDFQILGVQIINRDKNSVFYIKLYSKKYPLFNFLESHDL